jgi:FAD/FMN-containing dehydrogenase
MEDPMNDLKRALFSVFPGDRVSDDPAILAGYSADSATLPGSATAPSYVVLPRTTDEIVHLVQIANRARIPLVPMSRGSNIAGMSVSVQGGIVVDCRMMDRILDINTDSGYALIEPGVTLHKLSRALQKKRFFCHLPTATGGSSALANYMMRPSGNYSARWDPDPLLSLEVVTPGQGVVRTGSACFENVGWRARYQCLPDLTGLFANSFGTLGVVTRGSVKIFDRGETDKVLLVSFDEFAKAAEYMKLIVRRQLAESVTFWSWGWNLFHEMTISKETQIPEAMLKKDQKNPPPGIPFGIASARLSGYKEVVAVQEARCIKIAQELGGEHLDDDEAKKIHPGCHNYLNSYFGKGVHIKPGEESQIRAGLHLSGCLVTVEPAYVAELEAYMWDLAQREFEPPYFFRALPYSHAREFFFAFVVYVQGSLEERRDYLTHIKGIYHQLYTDLRNKYGAVMFRFRKYPDFLSYTGGYGDLLKDIKKSVDPLNIMNPGMPIF